MKTTAPLCTLFRRFTFAALFVVASAASAQVTVTWQGATDFGLGDSLGTPLPAGSLVKLGAFFASDAVLQAHAGDYAFLSANFVTFDTAAIGDGTGGLAGYWSSVSPSLSADALGVGGARMYLWAFNSATGATATAQGIFTSSDSAWVFPTDNAPLNFSVIELNQVDSIVIGSLGPSTFNLAAIPSAVPEPATTAGLAAVGVLLFAAGRRRLGPGRRGSDGISPAPSLRR